MGIRAWKCPKCGVRWEVHPKDTKHRDKCGNTMHGVPCSGLTCNCPGRGQSKYHGQTEKDPCRQAECLHCGWSGRMPYRGVQDDWRPKTEVPEFEKLVGYFELLIEGSKDQEVMLNRHLGYADDHGAGTLSVSCKYGMLEKLLRLVKDMKNAR